MEGGYNERHRDNDCPPVERYNVSLYETLISDVSPEHAVFKFGATLNELTV